MSEAFYGIRDNDGYRGRDFASLEDAKERARTIYGKDITFHPHPEDPGLLCILSWDAWKQFKNAGVIEIPERYRDRSRFPRE